MIFSGETEPEINFEFLIDGEFLRDSIEEHLRERNSLKTLKSVSCTIALPFAVLSDIYIYIY